MKINIIGQIFGADGYSRHTRSLANALNDIGLDVRLDVNKIPQWERLCNDFEFKAIEKPFNPKATTIMISQPPTWRLGLAQKPSRFFGFLVWEGDKIPEYWIPYLLDKRIDKILVPSLHTLNAIMNSVSTAKGLFHKIEIIPHGINPKIFYLDRKKEWKPFKDKFIIMANKGFSQNLYDRGGLQWLLKAFTEEFTNKDKIELRVHINPAYNSLNYNIDEEFKKIGLVKKSGNPTILVSTQQLDDDALRSFYNEGNLFISTSMADAFDLPVLESMACGVPALVTANSGHCDFVNKNNGWIIEEGEWINWSKEITYEETKWFKPNIKEISKMLRWLYEHQDAVKLKSAMALKDSKEWAWQKSAKKLRRLLE